MTGIFIAAIGGFILGALVYYVLGFDKGYADGRRDERAENWRRRKNEQRIKTNPDA